jgi:hypothetical protein
MSPSPTRGSGWGFGCAIEVVVPMEPTGEGREEHGMAASPTARTDWLRSVLFDRGYLAQIRGEAIKVYLVMVEACGGQPDRSVCLSLRALMERTSLSCPTVVDSLTRLEALGLVVSTTSRRGRTKTYYVPDPPRSRSA